MLATGVLVYGMDLVHSIVNNTATVVQEACGTMVHWSSTTATLAVRVKRSFLLA
jgi:hypothetical protein